MPTATSFDASPSQTTAMSPSYPAHDLPTTPLYLAYPPSRSIIQLCIMEHHHLTAVISTTTIDKAWRELRILDGTMLPQNIEKSARHRHDSQRKLELQCNCANGGRKPCGGVSRLLADVRCALPAGNQCLRHVSLRQKISTATLTRTSQPRRAPHCMRQAQSRECVGIGNAFMAAAYVRVDAASDRRGCLVGDPLAGLGLSLLHDQPCG